ncbi:MAG: alpha-amylase, partial [Clostridium celatum]|nr:alpha-amylase [Clostridium celatum]
MVNGTMMQYFEWFLLPYCKLWNEISSEASNLRDLGITALWMPPAYKGIGGGYDVGYGAYDLYDLGEFNQKGSIETKYGSKDEYLMAIKILNKNGIQSYGDIVLNHKMGADEVEEVMAREEEFFNRSISISGTKVIRAWTKFTFPGRNNKYSSFKWDWNAFDGIDYDDKTKRNSIYKFLTKEWSNRVDKENGNYDYLMGADLDFSNRDVVEELKKWGKWYVDFTNIDGFRLDAVKHINYEFFVEWLEYLRKESGKELFSVGEY